MESEHHIALKGLAAVFLIGDGFPAVATEVRCPGSRYRVDAAGYLDRIPWPKDADSAGRATLWSTIGPDTRARRDRRCEPRTIIIECKQSRSDFIRDDRRADELITLREEAHRWKVHLEEHRIKPHEPELRESGSALFADLETWNFSASRLSSYRRLLRRIRRIEEQIYGETKFCLMSRYRVADQLYLMIPRGLIRPREVPEGWGLIEVARAGPLERGRDRLREGHLECPSFHIALDARHLKSPPHFRARLLRNIAVAATRATLNLTASGATESQPVPRSATAGARAGGTSVPA